MITFDKIIQIISTLADLTGIAQFVIPYLTKILPVYPTIHNFVEQLKAEDENKRNKAIKILTKSVERNLEVIDYLIQTLENPDLNLNDTTYELQKHSIYRIFYNACKKRELDVVNKIKEIIEKNNGRWLLQIECFNVFGEIKGINAINILLEYINDPEWKILNSVIENLGKIESERPLERLLLVPKTSNSKILETLASTFGSIKSDKSLPYLYELLNHKEPNVRANAAKAIGDTGKTESLDNLFNVAKKENDGNVSSAIAEAMKKINSTKGKNFLSDAQSYFKENNKPELADIFISCYSALLASMKEK